MAWQLSGEGNMHETQIRHWDGPTAHEPRCGSKAPRRHCFLCDGVVCEFGIEFKMLARCPRLGNMIREGNLRDTQVRHRDGPTAHEARCGPSAPRRHCFLCDGVVFEFGIEFETLARCPRLANMIREGNMHETQNLASGWSDST